MIKRWQEEDKKPVDCERCSKCRTKRGNFCVVYNKPNQRNRAA
ncbi:putative NADH-dependent flavin oxidoreductase [Vibrio ponticus]|nr:putative NADH-dependent flavin oxidoreductase [Vibrio ponticus]